MDDVLRRLNDEIRSHSERLAFRDHLSRALRDSLSDLEAGHHVDRRGHARTSTMMTAPSPTSGRAISPATRARAARIVVDASRKSGHAVPHWISAIANQPR